MAVLTDDERNSALADLPGWAYDDGALRRAFDFPTFLAGIEAVRAVAAEAERADHHPDIDIRWRTVTFALVTHSAGGVTGRDVALAHRIDAIAAR